MEELCTYFSQHLGPFGEVLDKIEDLNDAVSNGLTKSAEVIVFQSNLRKIIVKCCFIYHCQNDIKPNPYCCKRI